MGLMLITKLNRILLRIFSKVPVITSFFLLYPMTDRSGRQTMKTMTMTPLKGSRINLKQGMMEMGCQMDRSILIWCSWTMTKRNKRKRRNMLGKKDWNRMVSLSKGCHLGNYHADHKIRIKSIIITVFSEHSSVPISTNLIEIQIICLHFIIT